MGPSKLLFFIIILAACLTQIAADIYTPSIPAIADHFDSTFQWVQWTMASYVFGVAVSQLFYGPLSEGIGRKKPIIIGLGIMLLGSLLAWMSTNVIFLIIARLIQGIGAGACAALWRSIIRDVLSGAQLAKYGSYFAIVITFVVPAAPTLGGYFQEYFGWQASFVFMIFYTLIALVTFVYGFSETSVHHHPDKINYTFAKDTFATLIKSPLFMGVTVCTFLSYGSLFASITIAPILLIHHLEMNTVAFGWLMFMGTALAYSLSGFTNGKLVTRFGIVNMMRLGLFIMLIAGILMLMVSTFFELSVLSVVLPIFLFYYGSTFIWPNAFALAFSPFGHIAGYAGALYGAMQIGGGAVITGLVSLLPESNQITLAMTILCTTSLAWIVLEKISAKPKEITAN
ncbi:MAG: multidrug effflux MFS transporter [Proteobacteria bacterium]|nr:multidrug effflux MFS transporter [Pseudomonadota bacterium]